MPRSCSLPLATPGRFLVSQLWLRLRQGLGVIGGSVLALGAATPVGAAEQVQVHWGLLQTTVAVTDIETAVTTGQVPEALHLYRPLLTAPVVRQTLNNPLSLDPAISDRIITDLMTSSNGQQLLDMLASVAPDISPQDLHQAIQTAAQDEAGFSILSILRALPGDILTVDGGKLLSLVVQLGLSQLEQTALSNVLNEALEEEVASTSTFNPATPGPVAFETWELNVWDPDRERAIPVDIYWNRRKPRGPLVVISHGFGADRRFFTYLAEHLASYGLTVVAIEHPGSNVEALTQSTGAILPTQEFIDRPQDVSLVLDRLDKLNKNTFLLRNRFNLEDVTLVGHSLGGYTGLVLAGAPLDQAALGTFCQSLEANAMTPADWLQCAAMDLQMPSVGLADDRITQLVIMNPITGHLFGADGLTQVDVPTLMLTSTQDGVTPSSEQQLRPFDQLAGRRALIAVIGGTHLSVGDPNNINPALTQIPFMPELPAPETALLRQYLKGTVLSFVMQQTPAAERYQPFLSPTYAQEFSTDGLPLRYSERLPEPVSRWLLTKQRLEQDLTPTWEQVVSLAHLEWIGFQQRVGIMRRKAIAHLPFTPPFLSRLTTPDAWQLAMFPNAEPVTGATVASRE
jgi:predicted dienelactone hydrolase